MPADALDARLVLAVGSLRVDVAFRAEPGVTILVGPSGSGKSTILGALAGLVRPETGRISIGGDPWFDSATGIDVPPHRRRLSLVFQSLALFPHLTALGNVEYGIERALPPKERRDRARSMLERMRVGHVAERRPRTFSGGEAQRVALARAFARSPRVVLLDEAFSAMDRELRAELGRDVKNLVAELGVPALLVTHQPDEARALGERAVAIRGGVVEAVGPVEDVVRGDGLAVSGPVSSA